MCGGIEHTRQQTHGEHDFLTGDDPPRYLQVLHFLLYAEVKDEGGTLQQMIGIVLVDIE